MVFCICCMNRKGLACTSKGCRPTATLPDPYQCISPTARRRLRVAVQYTLLAFVLLIVILWIGMEVQEYHVKHAPDTLRFYTMPQVCGITELLEDEGGEESAEGQQQQTSANDLLLIQTYVSADDAEESDDTFVAHCGDCGQCSNPQDISIYDETKNSLFGTTVDCAKQALVWGRKTAGNCMADRVGFTAGCNDCWVENIMCDLRLCLFICLWHGLFHPIDDTEASSQELNRCTLCDEKRCGPNFIACAGANRRRSGIVSDIERDQELEVCDSVHPKQWWRDEGLQEAWHRQEERRQHETQQQQQQISSSSRATSPQSQRREEETDVGGES